MNFLAHFLLSHQTDELIVGSFLGDFVKGKQYQVYGEPVQRGILLHREIDRYTDVHPVFLQSKHRLVSQHGHYSGVIVDMFYDYLLATRWSDFGPVGISLPQFTERIYEVLLAQVADMPPPAQRVLSYMQAHDWLTSYAQLGGIKQALQGLQRRTQFPNQMGEATDDLQRNLPEYAAEFDQFFPAVQQHAADYLIQHA